MGIGVGTLALPYNSRLQPTGIAPVGAVGCFG